MIEGPRLEGGSWTWRASQGPWQALFVGTGPSGERGEVLRRIDPAAPPVAWAKQVHSATVLPAREGSCGEGDALVARAGEPLALSIATADCVPVLLAGPGTFAAVHAGWRGLAAGVIGAAVQALADSPGDCTAWVGPAIGPCCYEVGDDVASQVAAASGPEVVSPGPAGRPHLDLPQAARLQLERAGIGRIEVLPRCTRCDEAHLWSYRRQGKGAGRNLAFLWSTP